MKERDWDKAIRQIVNEKEFPYNPAHWEQTAQLIQHAKLQQHWWGHWVNILNVPALLLCSGLLWAEWQGEPLKSGLDQQTKGAVVAEAPVVAAMDQVEPPAADMLTSSEAATSNSRAGRPSTQGESVSTGLAAPLASTEPSKSKLAATQSSSAEAMDAAATRRLGVETAPGEVERQANPAEADVSEAESLPAVEPLAPTEQMAAAGSKEVARSVSDITSAAEATESGKTAASSTTGAAALASEAPASEATTTSMAATQPKLPAPAQADSATAPTDYNRTKVGTPWLLRADIAGQILQQQSFLPLFQTGLQLGYRLSPAVQLFTGISWRYQDMPSALEQHSDTSYGLGWQVHQQSMEQGARHQILLPLWLTYTKGANHYGIGLQQNLTLGYHYTHTEQIYRNGVLYRDEEFRIFGNRNPPSAGTHALLSYYRRLGPRLLLGAQAQLPLATPVGSSHNRLILFGIQLNLLQP